METGKRQEAVWPVKGGRIGHPQMPPLWACVSSGNAKTYDFVKVDYLEL